MTIIGRDRWWKTMEKRWRYIGICEREEVDEEDDNRGLRNVAVTASVVFIHPRSLKSKGGASNAHPLDRFDHADHLQILVCPGVAEEAAEGEGEGVLQTTSPPWDSPSPTFKPCQERPPKIIR